MSRSRSRFLINGELDPYRYPQLVVPPSIPKSTSRQNTRSLATLPPLVDNWSISCDEAIRRYDRWFAGLRTGGSAPEGHASWVANWGELAVAKWKVSCLKGRLDRVETTLIPYDTRAEGITELGLSARRWLARMYPAGTLVRGMAGSVDGRRPTIYQYSTLGRTQPLAPLARLIVHGNRPEARITWVARFDPITPP